MTHPRPIHVLLALLAGLVLGLWIDHGADAAQIVRGGVPIFRPVHVPAAATATRPGSQPTSSDPAVAQRCRAPECPEATGAVPVRGVNDAASMPGLILDPVPSRTPVPRASVEQPAAAPLTVSKATKLSTKSGGGSSSVTGIASYYDWRPGEAAACAPLRAALGVGWRGRVVSVNGLSVRLTDYCPQEGRVIDLDSRTFALLAPLSRGLVTVSVSW